MFPLPRKLLALYLIASTTFTPLAPVFAAATPTTTNSHQQLPELGSAATSQQKTASASRATQTPEWMLHAATDQDLGPSALRNRAQGIEQAVAQGASMLSHAASDAAEQWFTRRHITAELALKSDQHGIHGGSLDMLVPFYQAGKDLLFTQVGIRRSNSYTENYRNTLNLGLGYRRNFAGWLLGANSFYDRDTTAKDGRLGAGVEAWTDYLKLSANSYLPLSGWKTTPERAGYQERAARGWDVRAEGYLPSYPQLGGKLIYEQYYGKGVSLFSANDRQENPRALTLGMIYNPIPLIGLGINHRIGQGGLADTSANLTLSYRLGESMAKQLSSSSMKARYLLENMRYDLVARNNEIVLNNRARAEQMRLPKEISGAEGHSVQFSLSSSVALQSLNWVGSAAAFALPYDGSGTATLHMPNYVSGLTNTYGLQAVGIDKNGRTVTSNLMTVSVHAVDFSISAQPAAILANGLSTTTCAPRSSPAKAKRWAPVCRSTGPPRPVSWPALPLLPMQTV
ncbi:MAG: inverse autotransporter beta domain-containing protein [Pseudomonas sp.]|uniref:inverse autotransporter beta domain-containing protein n=1 Tax=Pseudomonas sp. TaxID=306 RepID=UPI0030F1C170